MRKSEIRQTDLIVLKKAPYRETSLLIGGLSAEFGKLDFVAKGELKLSPKRFPVFDLFRIVQVAFSENGQGDLHNAQHAELVSAFDHLALNPEYYRFIANVGSFILKNSAPFLPSPLVWEALRNILRNLDLLGQKRPAPWRVVECSAIIKSTFLFENGLMPTASEDGSESYRIIDQIIEAGNEGHSLPAYPDSYWDRLGRWLNSQLKQHQLRL